MATNATAPTAIVKIPDKATTRCISLVIALGPHRRHVVNLARSIGETHGLAI